MTNRSEADAALVDRLVAMARDLVIIPSATAWAQQRERCLQSVHNHLDAIEGIEVRQYERNGYGSLVALPRGVDTPDVLMCAHADVVGLPHDTDYRSKLVDGRIVGPGVGDMKGQLAILLELFHDFHTHHPGVSLGMAVTSDEEVGGLDGVSYLFDEVGLRCGLALIPDGGSLDAVTVEEKGILHLRLSVTGQASHAARPWLVTNPLQTLVDTCATLRRRFEQYADDSPDHWYPTCTLTVVRCDNETTNRIPPLAEALLDVRFPPPHTMESMLAEIRGVLGESVQVELLVGDEPTHLAPDPEFIDTASAVLGRQVRQIRESGGSDARFIRRYGIPVVMARPYVGNLHSDSEWIDVDSMLVFYRICERYLERRLLGTTGDGA